MGTKWLMPGAKLDGASVMNCWNRKGDAHSGRADGVADAVNPWPAII